MKLLAGTHYDPVGAPVTKATSSLLAMTALDTTNLRVTFTAPSNGSVLVRMRVGVGGASTMPQILLGILQGASVIARQAPIVGHATSSSNTTVLCSSSIVVTGLVPGTSYTWDMAYGVEVVVASSVIRYGGQNNTTQNDNHGGASFEVWDTPGLLAAAHYDPGTAATSASLASAIVLTALDTTNLRLTPVIPSRGIVLVRVRGVMAGGTSLVQNTVWGVLEGATLRGRARGLGGANTLTGATIASTDQYAHEAIWLVTGLTAGSATWDAAYGVDGIQASAVVKYGGPDDTTTDNAWGGFSFDVWNVDDLPRAIGSVA